MARDGNLNKNQLRVNINLEQVFYKSILELIDSLEKLNVSVCLQEMSWVAHLNYHFWEIGTKKYVHTKILLSGFCVSSTKTSCSNKRGAGYLEIKPYWE